ncbi:MAG: carbohydrate-binding family 9-like protein [Vicinamibacterales bacterium]
MPAMLTAPFRPSAPASPADFADPAWAGTPVVPLGRTWRGDDAPPAIASTVRLLWTPDHAWFGFTCPFTELDVDADPDPAVERMGLWERDVCEVFVQGPAEPDAGHYKEFEVAPTGQWCDVAIHQPRVDIDWGWQSGMRAAGAIDTAGGVWRAAIGVPFDAVGGAPHPGDSWRINLFRVSRAGGARHFLAYAPTGTPAPDFHVPAAFVPLTFTR